MQNFEDGEVLSVKVVQIIKISGRFLKLIKERFTKIQKIVAPTREIKK